MSNFENEVDCDDGWEKVVARKRPQKQSDKKSFATNLFPLEFAARTIYRSIVTIQVGNEEKRKIWSNDPRNPNRIKNNFAIIGKVMEAAGFPENQYIYNAAAVMFTRRELNEVVSFGHGEIEELLTPDTKQELINFNKSIFVEIRTDPSVEINQAQNEVPDSDYLEMLTSQFALSKGNYFILGGTMVESDEQPWGDCSWCTPHGAVHKSCRVVEDRDGRPKPTICIDSSVVQLMKVMKLDELARELFRGAPDWTEFAKFIKNRKCSVQEYSNETETLEYTNDRIFTLKGVTFDVIRQDWFTTKYKDTKCPRWPAAVFLDGKRERHAALDCVKLAPLQKVHKEQLEKFHSIPAAPPPLTRFNEIARHFENLGLGGNPVLDHFGVTLSGNPTEKEPTILRKEMQPPTIRYSNRTTKVDQKGGWNGKRNTFVKPGRIDSMKFVIIPQRQRDESDITTACEMLVEVCEQHGMEIDETQFWICPENQTEEMFIFIESVFKQTAEQENNSMIVLISPESWFAGIHDVCKLLELMHDVPSQHIFSKTMRYAKSMTLEKISQKINVKSGGLCYQTISNSSMKQFFGETLIIGVDVNHPRTFERNGECPSVVGLSANSTANSHQFIGNTAYTESNQEIVDGAILTSFTQRSLREFVKHRGFPKRVWIFRDGVSEGQEPEAKAECQTIENSVKVFMKTHQPEFRPKFTNILVVKRHHTRFFVGVDRQNTPVDSVFSAGVKTFGKRMFFIQSYLPLQGTARIPAFLVLRDDEKLTDEKMVELIVESCNLHQITDSPTALPTPVVVAHEAASRGASIFRALKNLDPEIVEDRNWTDLSEKYNYHTKNILSTRRVV